MSNNSGWDDFDYQMNTGELGNGMFNDNSPFFGCFAVIVVLVIICFAMCS